MLTGYYEKRRSTAEKESFTCWLGNNILGSNRNKLLVLAIGNSNLELATINEWDLLMLVTLHLTYNTRPN
jgi:hypothetical protein